MGRRGEGSRRAEEEGRGGGGSGEGDRECTCCPTGSTAPLSKHRVYIAHTHNCSQVHGHENLILYTLVNWVSRTNLSGGLIALCLYVYMHALSCTLGHTGWQSDGMEKHRKVAGQVHRVHVLCAPLLHVEIDCSCAMCSYIRVRERGGQQLIWSINCSCAYSITRHHGIFGHCIYLASCLYTKCACVYSSDRFQFLSVCVIISCVDISVRVSTMWCSDRRRHYVASGGSGQDIQSRMWSTGKCTS